MSLKKIHEEMKEARQLSVPQETSSTVSTQETQAELIERQRQRIEKQNLEFEQLRQEYREELAVKENQKKRAWEEVDRLRSAPPKTEYKYVYQDKCTTCRLNDYKQSNRKAWRYVCFLSVMMIVGIICEVVQSRAFLMDLAAFLEKIMMAGTFIAIGPAFSGHCLAKAIGWLEIGSRMYVAGQVMRIVLPLLIYTGYFLLGKYVIPKIIGYFKESEKENHVPRVIGLHVFCAGIVIALCCAGLIPAYDGFRINSMCIPIVLYCLWLIARKYHEGGYWFKGWNKDDNYW